MSRTTTLRIDDRLVGRVEQHPEELGLDPTVSKSRRASEVFAAGLETLEARARDARRVTLYDDWAQDTERRDAVRAASRSARAGGVLGQ